MKIGDLVMWRRGGTSVKGIIVGFNKKGEGGKEFIHVLVDGEIQVFMEFDLEVIGENR